MGQKKLKSVKMQLILLFKRKLGQSTDISTREYNVLENKNKKYSVMSQKIFKVLSFR